MKPANDQVPQNPRQMSDKVSNFEEMQADLHKIEPFGLSRIPNFEPQRGPAVPSFVGCDGGAGLIFMPVRGGPSDAITDWLADQGELTHDFTQTSLRQWKRARPGHRSFTVLRHPVRRAWDAFQTLLTGSNHELRQLMRDIHRVALPSDDALAGMSDDQSADLFRDFLDFLKRNLNGQTTLSTHPGWATQSEVLAGFSRFSTPDAVLREDRMVQDCEWLAGMVGMDRASGNAPRVAHFPEFLGDNAIIKATRNAYLRDYIAFGFEDAPS